MQSQLLSRFQGYIATNSIKFLFDLIYVEFTHNIIIYTLKKRKLNGFISYIFRNVMLPIHTNNLLYQLM